MKNLSTLLFVLFLSGCGAITIPPALLLISKIKTGGDIASYIITKKSLVDNGISEVKQKDCAVYYIITEDGEICKDYPVSTFTIYLSDEEIKKSESIKKVDDEMQILLASFNLTIVGKPKLYVVDGEQYALYYMVTEK